MLLKASGSVGLLRGGPEGRGARQHGSDCCAWPSVRAGPRQAAAQLLEQVPAAQVRDGCLGDWDVRVHGLAVHADRVGYVNGTQAAHEEAKQQAGEHHSWLHSVGQKGIPKLLREVVGEVR
ncbi:hypothetical protein HaLaN_18625, partial [Haematococcus lacustris]